MGQPEALGGFSGKPGAGGSERLLQIAEPLHPLARQREDDGQGVGGGWKPDVLVAAVAVERLGQCRLCPPHAGVAAANGRRCDDLGHQFTPSRYWGVRILRAEEISWQAEAPGPPPFMTHTPGIVDDRKSRLNSS